tara:strand:- start:54 stop:476 length:423 start_codon:yes stop_codon:yes gene_type:complete
MKLTPQEVCIIKELIDFNSEYFNKAEFRNPIKESINDNLDFYNSDKKFKGEISQEMFHTLKRKIDKECFGNLTKEDKEIYGEVVNAYIKEGFLDWVMESDFKDISHNYISKCLSEFPISEISFLRIEGKLLDFISKIEEK